MKISSYILVILAIGLCFSLVSSMIWDMQVNYPEVSVDTSWSATYDYSMDINNSVSNLQLKFNEINQANGWWDKIIEGATAVPMAIMFVLTVTFGSLGYMINIFTGVTNAIGIPPVAIGFGVVALLVIVIFAVVSYWQRWKT